MLFQGGFTFTNFVADAFAVFMFVLWFWLFISVAGDLFRRHDVSGVGKVCWVILLIVLPYVGIFAYLLTQGRGMAERNEARAKQAHDDLRQFVGFSGRIDFGARIHAAENAVSAVDSGGHRVRFAGAFQARFPILDKADQGRNKNIW